MNNRERKKLVLRLIKLLWDIKSSDIAKEVNYSSSEVTKHLNCVRNCAAIDIWLIEKVFGIKVKEYSKTD